ncbi:MAG: hypothetical protein ISS26_04855 [Candidatus Omnitrophica bacterium]|nr:hypothetical protein [Candidatus Omnitrophota bacterium]
MPYDSSLDKKMFYETKEFESTRVTVGVFSYNNGEKKLQISRENVDPGGDWRFSKLGRMNKEEVGAIIPLMQSAIEKMGE